MYQRASRGHQPGAEAIVLPQSTPFPAGKPPSGKRGQSGEKTQSGENVQGPRRRVPGLAALIARDTRSSRED